MKKDWKYYFYEISKIPRKSGYEENIKNYLVEFSKDRNFKFYTDKWNNVIIWKPSTNKNSSEIIGLQAHTDMVCEKTSDSTHNFQTDSLELIEDDMFIKAKNTSLGADNGIGVAYILAILDSKDIEHPNIEAIFTTQEETTMNGAINIDANKLKSKKIISFDNFNDKELWIGSASSQEWYCTLNPKIIYQDDVKTFNLSLTNFIGGHAGMDIGDEKRGNPIKVAFSILKNHNVFINSISSGTLINVIPSNCNIQFSIKKNDINIINEIKNTITIMKTQYPLQNFAITETQKNPNMIDKINSKIIVDCINNYKCGAIYRDEKNIVIVGSNLAKVDFSNNTFFMNFSVRGNRRVLTNTFINSIKTNIIDFYNLNINQYDEWSGYEQSSDNELIKVCSNIYEKIVKEKPIKLSVQACLECEYFGVKIPNLQYVALGTNTYDVHSTSERLEINSANQTWNIILNILNYYANKKRED